MDIGVGEIREWHIQRGFSDVGYAYVIRRDGTLEPGRPQWAVGAHVSGSNHRSVGLCLVGGIDVRGLADFNFTRPQMGRLEALLSILCREYPGAEVIGHRDVPGVAKSCPSFDVPSWWDERSL